MSTIEEVTMQVTLWRLAKLEVSAARKARRAHKCGGASGFEGPCWHSYDGRQPTAAEVATWCVECQKREVCHRRVEAAIKMRMQAEHILFRMAGRIDMVSGLTPRRRSKAAPRRAITVNGGDV